MTGHTAFGAMVVLAFMSGVFRIAGIATEPSTGIDVTSLEFVMSENIPFVYQDRIVYSDASLTARWSATVSLIEGSTLTPICEGGGYWDYETGQIVAELLFDEWVGENGCFDRIPAGSSFVLAAEYKWADTGLERERSDPIYKR